MKLVRSLVAVLLLVVMFSATTVFACGPFEVEAIFVHTAHPGYPLERFARGQIGVVQPTYARSYLYVAYRYLDGRGFNESEQKELVDLWKDRLEYRWSLGDEEWTKSWAEARKRVPGTSEPPTIQVYRNREKPNDYEMYLNCQKDAFEVAIQTLNERLNKFGGESPTIRAWVEAQDQVFSNCGEGKNVPQPLEASTDPLARADRNYQIASANFYAGNYDEARNGFEAIGKDNNSPWQPGAPYLVARSLVRKASLGPAETRDSSLSEAEAIINHILSDRKQQRSHAAASRLQDLVRLRLHPKERLKELGQTLAIASPNQFLKQQLWDYTMLLDKFVEDEEGEHRKAPSDILSDDLTDWIATFQEGTDQALAHAIEKWDQTHSSPWLINVLTKLKGGHAKSSDFINEALKVQTGSHAFPSARFHAVRLLLESGKLTEARTHVDELLKARDQFDESAVNLLRSQRMLLSQNLTEFLTFAPRVPASLSWNDDGREIPAESEELSDTSKANAKKPLFDDDGVNAINRQLPLLVLKEAAMSSVLPDNLRRDLVQAAWLRAILLGNNQAATEITPSLKQLVPGIASLVDPFLTAQGDDAKRWTAIYAWLKYPGLEPVVDRGVSRETLNEQDIYRDNWWCAAAFPSTASNKEPSTQAVPITATSDVSVAFLSQAEREAARKERLALDRLGAAPNYISQQVIQWATKSPNDPRVPEALHLAVRTTRFGCTNKETGRWSKAVFDLLHNKYPTSTWAKKTPYWFKD